MALGIIGVLESRGLTVSSEQRARIPGVNDLQQLERWLRAVAAISSAEALLAQ